MPERFGSASIVGSIPPKSSVGRSPSTVISTMFSVRRSRCELAQPETVSQQDKVARASAEKAPGRAGEAFGAGDPHDAIGPSP